MINFCWNATHKREEKTVYEKLELRIEQLYPPLPDEPPPNNGKSYPIVIPQQQPLSRTPTPKGSSSL